ncbi:mechanosensitive ion channel [Thermoleophilia bacterium SCSIO 60948]|nr:mechanosensitive ion channel [Thermoleophilia bacterium SCSIO 60948]
METTFWESNGEWITAAITFGVAILIAIGIDRLLFGRVGEAAKRVTDASISRAATTRLRVVRRLVFVLIVLIGLALALGQFTGIQRIATGLLASTAVIGLVFGLAARQVLANPLAGILLAFTQPIRIGDTITIDEHTGRVDDLKLSYTYIDKGDGQLMIVPNEQVVTSVVFNKSTGNPAAPALASVWMPLAADVAAARKALEPLELSSIQVAEITAEGVRLEVRGPAGSSRTAASGEEAALRSRAHQALFDAGLLDAG